MAIADLQIVGGDPALDFLNTVNDWTVETPRDHIPAFADALQFGVRAEILTAAEAKRIANRSDQGAAEMRRLRELRERLVRIFGAAIDSETAAADDLEALARDAADAARHTTLRASRGGRITRAIDPETAGAATLRWRVVDAAVSLLTSQRLERLKSCPSCGWFFLDTTKNHSRRWCSMDMCGSVMKARAYYHRTKGRGPRSS